MMIGERLNGINHKSKSSRNAAKNNPLPKPKTKSSLLRPKDQRPKKMIQTLMYFPPTLFWSLWKQAGQIKIETADNYQKASYRNRVYIAGPQGIQPLGIPLLKGKNSQKPYREVVIDHRQTWQRTHWRAITAAYGKSPFFEHYESDLRPLFEQSWEYLFAFNLEALKVVKRLLKMDKEQYVLTEKYEQYPESEDFRQIIRPNRDINHKFVPYVQVFADKTGFVPNLSVLDLLFCMGPEAQRFL